MKIHTIFEGALYAFQWDEEETHCLDILTDLMSDIDFLRPFFQKRKEQLSFFKYRQPIDAAVKTLKEIKVLEQELYELAELGLEGSINKLENMFEPLDNRKLTRNYIQAKAKGNKRDAPWIRIYGIRVDENEFFITGGGIKLVEKMEDDKYLNLQLKRLRKAEDYLSQVGLI